MLADGEKNTFMLLKKCKKEFYVNLSILSQNID